MINYLQYVISIYDKWCKIDFWVLQTAKKFGYLDKQKSPPILRLFQENLEIVQTLLGSIEASLIDSTDEGIVELQTEVAGIMAKIKQVHSKVVAWNKKHFAHNFAHNFTGRLSITHQCPGTIIENDTISTRLPSQQ